MDHPTHNPAAPDTAQPRTGILRYLGLLAILGIGYWAVTSFCFERLTHLGDRGLAWPPLALALAICAVMGLRFAPAIFLGSILVPLTIGHPPSADPGAVFLQLKVGIWIALADTSGALAGAWLIRRFCDPAAGVARLRDAVIFLCVVVPFSSAVAVGINSLNQFFGPPGADHYHSAQSSMLTMNLRRTLCNAAAVLLITPLLLAFVARPARPHGRRLLEAIAILSCAVATSVYAFASMEESPEGAFALAYLPIPTLIWGALRFGVRGSLPLAVVICTIAATDTIYGRGPLTKGTDEQSMVLFWGFCAVVGTMSLLVGAAVDERAQSTQALRRSEQRHRQLVENAREGIWLLDDAWKTTFVNPWMATLLGYSAESMIGMPFSHFLSESDRARVQTSMIRRVVRPDEQQEVCFRRSDRSLVWALVSTTSLKGPAGEPIGFMALVTDITQRRQAEDELRASRQRLELAIWGTNLGLWDWNLRTNQVQFSDVWKRQIGYEPHELPDSYETWESRLHPDDKTPTLRRLHQYLANPVPPYETSFRLRQRDGSYRWIMARGYLILGLDGQPERLAGVHIDISDSKLAEEELQRSTQRLRLALDAAQLGVWDWSVADARLHDSPGAAQIFGVPFDPDRDPREHYARCIHPDDVDPVRAQWRDMIQGARELSIQFRIIRPDGAVRWLAAKGALISDNAGRPQRASGIISDITDRKLAGAERRRLQEQLHRAQKLESLGILAGGVAHDFSNLLAGILGHVGLLQRMIPTDSALRATIDTIEHTTRRAGELTRQLLAYSGRGGIVREHVDLSAVARDALTLVSGSLSPTAQVRLDLSPEPVLTEANITQIRQIAMNLITNASDSLEKSPGTITIRTGTFDASREFLDGCILGESASPGRFVFLEISDTGAGILQENLPRIFDPFFTTKFTGRGLGLAAVLGSVRGHAGVIHVRSSPHDGTAFRVLLAPADAASPRQPANLPAPLPDASHQSPAPADNHARPGRVLVVDDEDVVRRMAVLSLGQQGFEVLDARDGQAAIDILRANTGRVDAVLLDLTMPGMSGIEALARLRELDPTLPVVLTSGYSDSSAINLPKDGRTTFLSKPFSIEEMVREIRSIRRVPADRPD